MRFAIASEAAAKEAMADPRNIKKQFIISFLNAQGTDREYFMHTIYNASDGQHSDIKAIGRGVPLHMAHLIHPDERQPRIDNTTTTTHKTGAYRLYEFTADNTLVNTHGQARAAEIVAEWCNTHGNTWIFNISNTNNYIHGKIRLHKRTRHTNKTRTATTTTWAPTHMTPITHTDKINQHNKHIVFDLHTTDTTTTTTGPFKSADLRSP